MDNNVIYEKPIENPNKTQINQIHYKQQRMPKVIKKLLK